MKTSQKKKEVQALAPQRCGSAKCATSRTDIFRDELELERRTDTAREREVSILRQQARRS